MVKDGRRAVTITECFVLLRENLSEFFGRFSFALNLFTILQIKGT